MSPRLAFSLLVLTAAPGCPDGAYTVRISYEPGVDTAIVSALELALVESCAEQPLGAVGSPVGVLRSVAVQRSEPVPAFGNLGDERPGGLWGRARDADCGVVAEGCLPIDLEPGGGGPLELVLAAPTLALGCTGEEICDLGQCVPTDVAARCASEGGRCAVGDEEGTCHDEVCCTGCWDGTSCRLGTASASCGSLGRACTSCECPTSACVDGACTEGPAVVATTAGNDFECAIDVEQRLFCWGANGQDETGTGLAAELTIGTPTAVGCADLGCDPALRWSRVIGGEAHGCGVLAEEALACWGNNADGQLAIPVENGITLPRRVPSVPFERALSLGTGAHGCGIDGEGRLSCWGLNASGELGCGDTAPREVPCAVDGPERFVEVAVADDASCAITEGGALFCWGSNQFGRLGIGSADVGPFPSPVEVDGAAVWSDLRAARRGFCARRDGRYHCWGFNHRGQLGVGDTVSRDTPTALEFAGEVRELACGSEHGVLIDADGVIHSWGRNEFLQTLRPGADDPTVPTPAPGTAGRTWSAVAAGSYHTCAIDTEGRLFCGGRDHVSQLGQGPPGAPSDTLLQVCLPTD